MYLVLKYEVDLALNNVQWLICHKTKPKHQEIQMEIMGTKVEEYRGKLYILYGIIKAVEVKTRWARKIERKYEIISTDKNTL